MGGKPGGERGVGLNGHVDIGEEEQPACSPVAWPNMVLSPVAAAAPCVRVSTYVCVRVCLSACLRVCVCLSGCACA
ncbi:hypothetical protein LZ30DRAFT_731743 [Colletotrichum cereale]|nr:hypothetical protein LZ30DRAFT_731743 [Colletotrichum cereale]